MSRPVFIAWLELKRYLSDRGLLLFSIALPILLFVLIYAAFGGDISFTATAHIVDLDNGEYSDQLLERLGQVDGVTIKLYTEEEANAALDRASMNSVVVVPANFTQRLDAGEPVSITFRQRGSGGDEGQIVASIVQGISQQIASNAQVRSTVARAVADTDVSEEQVRETVDALLTEAGRNPPVLVDTRSVGGSDDPVNRMMPGVLVMFLLFAVSLGAQTIVEERRIGTLERLLTTRLNVNELFVGKFFAGVARALVQAVILLVLAFVALRVAGPLELLQVIAFSALVAAAVSAIGLLIAVLSRTQDQATWFAVLITMFMTIFGGTFSQVEGGALDILSRMTLNRYAIDAIESIISGRETLVDQGFEVAVMVGVTIVALIAARIAFRASEGKG